MLCVVGNRPEIYRRTMAGKITCIGQRMCALPAVNRQRPQKRIRRIGCVNVQIPEQNLLVGIGLHALRDGLLFGLACLHQNAGQGSAGYPAGVALIAKKFNRHGQKINAPDNQTRHNQTQRRAPDTHFTIVHLSPPITPDFGA